MEPTIGSVVIYHCSEEQKEKMNNYQDFAPAIVTAVWGDTCVNLKVLLDGTENLWVTSAQLGDEEYQWNWPKMQR